MSRKHYEQIALAIKANDDGDSDTLLVVACDLASLFAEDNPRFDPERFMAACGFDPEEYSLHGGHFGATSVQPVGRR